MNKILSAILLISVIIFYACDSDKSKGKINQTSGDKVLDELNALVESEPADPSRLYQRAEYQFNNENYDACIDDLNQAIKMDSTKVEYYHLLSDAYMDYYRSKDALQTMEKCVVAVPKDVHSLLKLSETQLILKKYDESLMSVNKILSMNDQNAEAFFMMGMNLKAQNNKEKAISAFQMATEIDPELIDAWMILGDLFSETKNPLALDYYNAAIELAPENPATYHSKAFYLQNNGKVNEAIALYKEINMVDKNYADAYLNMLEQLKVSSKEDTAILFQGLVESCMNCHRAMCPGPMVRIKKLYLKKSIYI
mgnify:CR=1 FL=1